MYQKCKEQKYIGDTAFHGKVRFVIERHPMALIELKVYTRWMAVAGKAIPATALGYKLI
jgi:hypothetical protein